MNIESDIFRNPSEVMPFNFIGIFKDRDFYLNKETVSKIIILNTILLISIGCLIASLTALFKENIASLLFAFFSPLYLPFYEFVESYFLCRKI